MFGRGARIGGEESGDSIYFTYNRLSPRWGLKRDGVGTFTGGLRRPATDWRPFRAEEAIREGGKMAGTVRPTGVNSLVGKFGSM